MQLTSIYTKCRTLFLWLLLAVACFLPASALSSTASENRVWEIFSIGYDAATAEATDLGSCTETPTSDYDSAPIHGANIEEIPTEANRTLFGQNAEFKAAKGAVNVIEEANGAIHLTVGTSKGTVEVISNIAQEGDTLTLSQLHIGGPGAGTLGRAGMNELKTAASQFGAQRGASTVIIQGAMRTTGRYAGKVPSPIIIKQ